MRCQDIDKTAENLVKIENICIKIISNMKEITKKSLKIIENVDKIVAM